MTLLDIFVGVPQSKYAGAAILMSLIAVSLAILIGRDALPLSQKFAFVLLIFLVSLPGLLLTLFQLTCMVTGDKGGKAWWCGVYSWVVSALLIIYSVLLVSVAVLTLASGGKVMDQIAKADAEHFYAAKKAAEDNAQATFMDKAINGQASIPAPVTQPQQVHPGTSSQVDTLTTIPQPQAAAVPSDGASSLRTRSFSDMNNVAAYDTKDSFANLEGFADAAPSMAAAPAATMPAATATSTMPSTAASMPSAPAAPATTQQKSCPPGCMPSPM